MNAQHDEIPPQAASGSTETSSWQTMTTTAQASHWIVHLDSGDASAAEWAAFDRWLSSDASHRYAFAQVQRLWRGVEDNSENLADLLQTDTASAAAPTRTRTGYKKILGALSLAACLVVAIMAGWRWTQQLSNPDQVTYSTRVAEIRKIPLPDGSLVTLGARSTIQVNYQPDVRQIELKIGEAFFSVAANANRPFYVRAGNVRARVVGTEFDVHLGREIKVAVLEGVVDVAQLDPSVQVQKTESTRLAAGQQIATVDGVLADVTAAKEPGAWRRGRLNYVGEPLQNVIADANRYYDRQIVLASADLAELKVTASFKADQIEQMIISLSETLRLAVHREGKSRVILYKP